MTILVCDDDKEIVEAIEIYLMQGATTWRRLTTAYRRLKL